jgi:hypothetical protein
MARDAQIGVGSATDLRGVLTGDDRVHPEPGPVPSDLARGFGVFDHWFRECRRRRSRTGRSGPAATSSGFSANSPVQNWLTGNTAETIFNRLEHGKPQLPHVQVQADQVGVDLRYDGQRPPRVVLGEHDLE